MDTKLTSRTLLNPLAACVILLFVGAPGFGQQPGTIRWRARLPLAYNFNAAPASSPAIGPDGTIYVGTGCYFDTTPTPGANMLYAFSAQGQTNWVFHAGNRVVSSPAIGADGTVYVGSLDGNLYAISPSGATNWTFQCGAPVPSSPALGADGTIYFGAVTNDFNKLFALHPDGTPRWVFSMGGGEYPASSGQFASPAIGPNGTIYVGSLDGNLYALNPDGTTNWVFPLGAKTYSSPAIGADGTLYLGAQDKKVRAIDFHGCEKWAFLTGRPVESSAVIGNNGTVYIGSLDGYLYALDANGAKQWAASGGLSCAPALAADGTIYTADNGVLRAYNSAGSSIWALTLGLGYISFSSPAIGPDGTIYVVAGMDSSSGALWAVYGASELQAAPWPMFHRQPSHAARVPQRAITSPTPLPDGSFGLSLSVETGRTYRVRASADLTNWTEITNFTATGLTQELIDHEATNFPSRFYQLLTP